MGGRGFEASSRDAEGVEGVGNGEGVSPPQPTMGFGERREFPQRGPGRSPGQKRISVLSKRHKMPVIEKFLIN